MSAIVIIIIVCYILLLLLLIVYYFFISLSVLCCVNSNTQLCLQSALWGVRAASRRALAAHSQEDL